MEWIKKILGYDYLLNTNTGEVHYLPKANKRCAIGGIKEENKLLISKARFRKLRGTWHNGHFINGCKWCLRKHDLG